MHAALTGSQHKKKGAGDRSEEELTFGKDLFSTHNTVWGAKPKCANGSRTSLQAFRRDAPASHLLGDMARVAYETVREVVATSADDRPHPPDD